VVILSELRGKETDPQQDRVGFKQVLAAEDALATEIRKTHTTPTRKELLGDPDMPTINIPCYLHDLLINSRPKACMAGQEGRNIPPDEDKSNICKTLEHLFVLLIPMRIQQMWLKN
jgi:hypothetical protein